MAILAAERGRVWTTVLTLAEHPHRTILIQVDPAAGPAQREAFTAWTGQVLKPVRSPEGRR